MWIHLIFVSAAAKPQFEGNEATVALAAELWAAAEGCAGRAALAHDVVPIRRQRSPQETAPSRTEIDAGGLVSVEIVKDRDPLVLAHGLAEAWFAEAPHALRQGLANHLAECVARSRPGEMLATRRDANSLKTLTDLREWTESADLESDELRAHHSASWRLVRLLAELLPDATLYDPGFTSWEAVTAALAESEGGDRVIEMLQGGKRAQREGLSDSDMDGLVGIREAMLETDPDRWDTDGDGWWDGVRERPEGAIPVARDGSPACLNEVARSGPTAVEFGGEMLGATIADLEPTEFTAGELWRLPPALVAGRGGHWVRASGDGLMPNPSCAWTPQVTVHVGTLVEREATAEEIMGERYREARRPPLLEDATAAQLRALAVAIGDAHDAYAEEYGPVRWRTTVELGLSFASEVRTGDRTPAIAISSRHFRWAMKKPEHLEELAHVAVSLQRLTQRSAGAAHPATALLFASHNLGRKVPRLVKTYGRDIKRVRRQLEAECEDGWVDVFDKFCLDQIYED